MQTIEIPYHLATLLATKKTDLKDPKKYDDLQESGKALLRVIIHNHNLSK